MKEFAEFATRLADAASTVTLPACEQLHDVEDKNAGGVFDPVTAADRSAEQAMRALIEAAHPGHGISGEEFPDRPAQGRHAWSLDPIDGTRSFICGLPSWTTLIALLEDGAPVLGLIDAPRLDERYLGYDDSAWRNGSPIRTSQCRRLADAKLLTTDAYLFADAELAAFDRIRRSVRLTRFGHDGYGYARLAAGGVDVIVESGLKSYDWHALAPVVRGAGGLIGNWRGEPDCSSGQVVAAATRELFDETVRLLSPSP